MKFIGRIFKELKDFNGNFTLEALANHFQPRIPDVLRKHQKDRQRQSKLSPLLTVWLILTLPLRRELNYHNVLAWLLSGLRFLGGKIPRHPVQDGAITHARQLIGTALFRDLFAASRELACQPIRDFHGLTSVALDGTGLTMPDTPSNLERFGKPGTARGQAAFPQLRMVAIRCSRCSDPSSTS
ncbi:MAG: transposase domain-containing protein [Planctomycetes bacterium]|nr:transposase domain-containing protein [Planctomycetota bacterium]